MKRKLQPPKNKKVKFIPCSEFAQTYRWSKTNKGDKIKRTK